jgi:hypothetical protein
MIRTSSSSSSVLTRIIALIFIVGVLAVTSVSIQDTPVYAISGMPGGNSSQGIANTTDAGSNITGSLSFQNMLIRKAGSAVHLSLANASTIAEKTVGPNSHAVSVRIGVVHGFVVYIALVQSGGIHRVLVDAGNGKALSTTQLSIVPSSPMAR